MIQEKPRKWHEHLSEALWAARNTANVATGFTPYKLTFGHEAVVPAEITVPSIWVQQEQGGDPVEDEHEGPDGHRMAMLRALDDLDEIRFKAMDNLEKETARRARMVDQRVRTQSFETGDLVWKVVLPRGVHNQEFGKWAPNWEGPYIIKNIINPPYVICVTSN